MKLEKQVVSLELAKRLKELGVRQESSFHWLAVDLGWVLDCLMSGEPYYSDEGDKEFSAFTVAELGEMLPVNVCYRWTPRDGRHCLSFGDTHKEAITEADARAKMLIYLKENKLI